MGTAKQTGGEFLWPVTVYYEDTDAGGVVYYANYLKFMERARTEWLRALGFEQDELRNNEQILFAVQHIDIHYHQPAQFNDRLMVGVKMAGLGAASLQFDQTVARDNGDILCSGRVKIACLDAQTLRPKKLPESIVTELKSAG